MTVWLVFWAITPCSLLGSYQHIGNILCPLSMSKLVKTRCISWPHGKGEGFQLQRDIS